MLQESLTLTSSRKSSIDALIHWIERYATSPNTWRTYRREFERLQAWLLSQKLTFETVGQSDLERYLHAFAAGEIPATKPGAKSARTLSLTRDVVLRMLSELERKGIRKATPITDLKLPRVLASQPEQSIPSPEEIEGWEVFRRQWHDRNQPTTGSRDPLERQFFIAEFIFCMAMTAKEIADGVMSDFKALEGTWQLQIRHKGILTEKFIPVPAPAMAMLKRYRESRGLSSYPDASEMDVPIVARQRSERKVNAWAIAKCLNQLSESAPAKTLRHERRLSSRRLRSYLILRSLSREVDERAIRRHVRSDYAVSALSSRIADKNNSIASSLST